MTAACTTLATKFKVRSATTVAVSVRASSTASTTVPLAESWLWKNSTALGMVLRGLDDVKHGRVVSGGSFAEFASLDVDDE